MHNEFKELLPEAKGNSEFVIAVNLDIRGFSEFSRSVESQEAAIFIKKFYDKVLTNYFKDKNYFKPTGDGLLVIIVYEEDDLEEKAGRVLKDSISLLKDFSSICEGDPMINFNVPNKLGIGISRGSACRLGTPEKILDYSGQVLNLASRLMDIARPQGVVFDINFDVTIIPEDLMELFDSRPVYLRGVAEGTSLVAYYTKEYTRIPSQNLKPLDETTWETHVEKFPCSEIVSISGPYRFLLQKKPLDANEVQTIIRHNAIIDGEISDIRFRRFEFEGSFYLEEAGKPYVIVDFADLAESLRNDGIPGDIEIEVKIIYPVL